MVYTIPTNSTNPMEVVVDVSTQIPVLFPGILFLVWIVIFSSGYYAQERRTGKGFASMWASIASLITTTGAFVLFLYPGLLSLETLVVCVVVTLFSVMWFILGTRDSTL